MTGLEGVTIGAVALILIREFVSLFTDRHKKNTDALLQNTHAIIKLETKIDALMKAVDAIPEMQRDLMIAHEKIRSLNERFKDRN